MRIDICYYFNVIFIGFSCAVFAKRYQLVIVRSLIQLFSFAIATHFNVNQCIRAVVDDRDAHICLFCIKK